MKIFRSTLTQGLHSSSFWGFPCSILNMNPKKEPLWSLRVTLILLGQLTRRHVLDYTGSSITYSARSRFSLVPASRLHVKQFLVQYRPKTQRLQKAQSKVVFIDFRPQSRYYFVYLEPQGKYPVWSFEPGLSRLKVTASRAPDVECWPPCSYLVFS